MENILVFLILVAIVVVLFSKSFEKFQGNNDTTRFKGSVHVRGGVSVLANGNERVKFDKLCIRDSKTGLTSCIDSQKMAYLVNNKDHRLKLFCLGNTCINKNHLDILNGNNSFKLRDMSESNQCLSTIGNKWIHWRENQKHLQHDDNDDARFQLLQNPITYRDCDTTENINFKIEPIDEAGFSRRGGGSGGRINEVASGAYSNKSSKYIRTQTPSSNKVAISS